MITGQRSSAAHHGVPGTTRPAPDHRITAACLAPTRRFFWCPRLAFSGNRGGAGALTCKERHCAHADRKHRVGRPRRVLLLIGTRIQCIVRLSRDESRPGKSHSLMGPESPCTHARRSLSRKAGRAHRKRAAGRATESPQWLGASVSRTRVAQLARVSAWLAACKFEIAAVA